MDPALEIYEPDETRPSKRVRLEASLETTEELQDDVVDDDDWDDIYDARDEERVATKLAPGDAETTSGVKEPSVLELVAHAMQTSHATMTTGNLSSAGDVPAMALEDMAQPQVGLTTEYAEEAEEAVPPEALDDGNELVDERLHVTIADDAAVRMLEDTSAVNGDPYFNIETSVGSNSGNALQVDPQQEQDVEETEEAVGISAGVDQRAIQPPTKPAEDDEFLAAAAVQKDDEQAEWQYDSSDAESTSESDSESKDDQASDSESDGGYEMLDAATAAKILMSGDGDDDDGEKGAKKAGGDHQPRTANEQKEVVVPKPDVVITENMKITELGAVDRIVEKTVLIKAFTPGEYQVLESGSVLCNSKREVIGAVAETLGRVQEPMYSVAFTNAQGIEEAGLAFGARVYYVDNYSTFVFTQPLKNLRGTDASNLHDEEVGDDELEFSDDEAEAEYKRQKKWAKKGGRGGFGAAPPVRGDGPRSFGAPGHDSGTTYVNGSDAPQAGYGGGLSYDEDEVVDEFYSPLKRPDNLSQMMAGSAPPLPRPQQNSFDRGRGRGRGDRGRGDRGRGRGGFGDRGRGRGGFQQDRGQRGGPGRGGFAPPNGPRGNAQANGNRGNANANGPRGNAQPSGHRGNAQSFPDRHNHERVIESGRNSLPARPPSLQSSPPPQPQQYPPHNQFQPPPQQAPQAYQFNGYTFQFGNAAPAQYAPQASYYQQPPQPPTPGGSIPPGALVNPAFYQGQQQPQWPAHQQQQQQTGYGGWQGPPFPQAAPGPAASAQAYVASVQQQQQSNLADILRNLGGRPQ